MHDKPATVPITHTIQFVMLGARRIVSEDHEALTGTYINRMSDIYSLEPAGRKLDTDRYPTGKGCNVKCVFSLIPDRRAL